MVLVHNHRSILLNGLRHLLHNELVLHAIVLVNHVVVVQHCSVLTQQFRVAFGFDEVVLGVLHSMNGLRFFAQIYVGLEVL